MTQSVEGMKELTDGIDQFQGGRNWFWGTDAWAGNAGRRVIKVIRPAILWNDGRSQEKKQNISNQ